jgi:hypothetical protein
MDFQRDSGGQVCYACKPGVALLFAAIQHIGPVGIVW